MARAEESVWEHGKRRKRVGRAATGAHGMIVLISAASLSLAAAGVSNQASPGPHLVGFCRLALGSVLFDQDPGACLDPGDASSVTGMLLAVPPSVVLRVLLGAVSFRSERGTSEGHMGRA
ncbi:hypothetical protein Emed_006318 [Eimeria media]